MAACDDRWLVNENAQSDYPVIDAIETLEQIPDHVAELFGPAPEGCKDFGLSDRDRDAAGGDRNRHTNP